MKKIIIAQLIAAFLLAPLSFAEDLREFTSADGSKSLKAKIISVNSKNQTVTMLLDNGRQMNAPVKAFSEKDQEHIIKAGEALNMGKMLSLRFNDVEETVSEKKNPTHGYQTLKLKSGFNLEIRNNSPEKAEDLELEYQIFYKAYTDPIKSRDSAAKVAKGEAEVPPIRPGSITMVNDVVGVDLTSIKQLPRSECAGGT